MSSGRIGLTTKSGIQKLSLSQADTEEIKKLYATLETAVSALESSRPWLNEFARRVANGDARLPGLMRLFFKVGADPLAKLLSPESLQDWLSNSERSEQEFTAQTMHSEPEFSDKSIRTLERYFLRLQRSGVALATTKGKWGKRGS